MPANTNEGFDGRFVVQDLLGTGSFGQVVKVIEKGTDELFAIKLVKNLPAYHNQGLVEVSVLERVRISFCFVLHNIVDRKLTSLFFL